MEHVTPVGGIRGLDDSNNDAGTRVHSTSTTQYADIVRQAGSAAAGESSSAQLTTQVAGMAGSHDAGLGTARSQTPRVQQIQPHLEEAAAEAAVEASPTAEQAEQRAHLIRAAVTMMSSSTHAPSEPHVLEIIEKLVECGVADASNLVLSAYICGQPSHVAEVASRMLAFLLDEGHDPDALLEYAAWIPIFCSLLPDSFATDVARATCVQFVREHGSGHMLTAVDAESRPLLKMLGSLLVRDMRPLIADFKAEVSVQPVKKDLQMALHEELMRRARAGAARAMHAESDPSEPSVYEALIAAGLSDQGELARARLATGARGAATEAANATADAAAEAYSAAIVHERARIEAAAAEVTLTAQRAVVASLRESTPAHVRESFDIFVQGAARAGHDSVAAAAIIQQASRSDLLPLLRWDAAAHFAARQMRDTKVEVSTAWAQAIRHHTLPGTTSSTSAAPPTTPPGGKSTGGSGGSDGPPTPSSVPDVGDVSHVRSPVWYDLPPSRSEVACSIAEPRAWAATLAAAPMTKGQLKELHVTQHTLLRRISYPQSDYKSYITARPLLQQDLGERYVHRLAQQFTETRAVTDVARELAAAARDSPLSGILRSVNHLETRGHAGIVDFLQQLDEAYLPHDGSFAIRTDFESNTWKEGDTLLTLTLRLIEDANALLPEAEHGDKVTGLLGRELYKCRREYEDGHADVPYQLHMLLDTFGVKLGNYYKKQLSKLVEDLRSDSVARGWGLVRYSSRGSRGRGQTHVVDLAEAFGELSPTERATLLNALQGSDDSATTSANCTYRGANMDIAALVSVGLLPAEAGGRQLASARLFAAEATPQALRANGRPGPCDLCFLHPNPSGLVFYADAAEYEDKWGASPYSTAREVSSRPIDDYPNEFLCHWPHKCPIGKEYIRDKVTREPGLRVHLGLCLSDADFSQLLSTQRPPMFRTLGKGKGRGGGKGGKGGSGGSGQ